jgi:hypothetical protein
LPTRAPLNPSVTVGTSSDESLRIGTRGFAGEQQRIDMSLGQDLHTGRAQTARGSLAMTRELSNEQVGSIVGKLRALMPNLTGEQVKSVLHHLRGVIETVAPHAPAAAEALAAIFAISEGAMGVEHVSAARLLMAVNVLSGVMWTIGALTSEANNHFDDAPHSYRLSAANALGAIAGITSTVSSAVSVAKDSIGFGFTSDAAWIANAMAVGSGAARLHDRTAKSLQLGSAAAGCAAGIAAMLATDATKRGDSEKAIFYTILFGTLWLVAAAAAEGAVLRDNYVTVRANRSDDAMPALPA